MHYAEVFNALANQLGFESYVVEGMTKQNGQTDGMAHAWNATKLDGKWYLFDATWGSGSVSQGKFIKKLDNQYYKVKPEKLAKTHYPFDYIWQFTAINLSRPMTFCMVVLVAINKKSIMNLY
jgi:transglutaminase/protease-like cytokinesis protein 3